MPCCFITGPSGSGKRRFAQEVAAIIGRELLCVDVKAIHNTFESFSYGLSCACREAMLHHAVLCLFGWEALILPTTAEDANFHASVAALHLSVCRCLDSILAWHPQTIIITCQNSVSFAPRLETRNVEALRLTMPDHHTSRRLWDVALPEKMRDSRCDIPAYAKNFHLTPGQIADAVRVAAYQSEPSPVVNSDYIIGAVKQLVVQSIELLKGFVLVVEHLYDFLTAYGFLDIAVYCADGRLLCAIIFRRILCNSSCCKKKQRKGQRQRQKQGKNFHIPLEPVLR